MLLVSLILIALFVQQTKRMAGRSHWGKSGMVYHSSAMLNLKLEPLARQNFIGKKNHAKTHFSKFQPTIFSGYA